MPEILHEISAAASPDRVFDAITTQEGLASWWTVAVVAEPRLGTVAEFGFYNRATVFRMEIDAFEPAHRVHWTCIGGPTEWTGTQVSFDLTSAVDGRTNFRFSHTDLPAVDETYARRNTTWGHLMYHLKRYVEGEGEGPHFSSGD